jgi:hypothetical protein
MLNVYNKNHTSQNKKEKEVRVYKLNINHRLNLPLYKLNITQKLTPIVGTMLTVYNKNHTSQSKKRKRSLSIQTKHKPLSKSALIQTKHNTKTNTYSRHNAKCIQQKSYILGQI